VCAARLFAVRDVAECGRSTAVFMTSPAAAGALAVQPTGGSVRRDTDFVVPLGGTYAVAPDHTERSIDALMDSGIRAVFGYGAVKPPQLPGKTKFSKVPHP
jgi:hypothetical protein